MIQLEPMAGDEITNFCRKAAKIAKHAGERVCFRFNDMDLHIDPGGDPTALAAHYEAENKRRYDEWRKSPEGQADARKDEKRRKKAQLITNQLIVMLPAAIENGLNGVVGWCADLSEHADHIGLTWDKDAVADTLEAAGYMRNAHVGMSPEVLQADRVLAGEYLVGQAIDNLRRGHSPHPIIRKFAADSGFIEAE